MPGAFGIKARFLVFKLALGVTASLVDRCVQILFHFRPLGSDIYLWIGGVKRSFLSSSRLDVVFEFKGLVLLALPGDRRMHSAQPRVG